MWGVSYLYSDSANLHDHYPATWSCVYYLDVPENSSPLIFPSPNIKVKPWEGLLLIFPGNIAHCVPPSTTNKSRVAVSANLYINKLK
jgi:hypothetical protein